MSSFSIRTPFNVQVADPLEHPVFKTLTNLLPPPYISIYSVLDNNIQMGSLSHGRHTDEPVN